MSYRNWKHILSVFNFQNSVSNSILEIKHTMRDPLVRDQPQLLTLFFFSLGSVSLGLILLLFFFFLSHWSYFSSFFSFPFHAGSGLVFFIFLFFLFFFPFHTASYPKPISYLHSKMQHQPSSPEPTASTKTQWIKSPIHKASKPMKSPASNTQTPLMLSVQPPPLSTTVSTPTPWPT